MPKYTEGVCGDGVAILRDGVPVPISEILRRLNGVDRRCGTCTFWRRSGPTSGICHALKGVTNVPPWAAGASNSCTHQDGYQTCPVWRSR